MEASGTATTTTTTTTTVLLYCAVLYVLYCYTASVMMDSTACLLTPGERRKVMVVAYRQRLVGQENSGA